MPNPAASHPAATDDRIAARLGFWAALLTALLTAFAFALGILTPPRSGVFCTGVCIPYPYTAAAQFVPGDFRWMLPGILILPAFLVLAACIHCSVPPARRLFSLLALAFASIAAAIVVLDYFIQLQVYVPSLLAGETAALSLLTQYNAHGIFIALENLGYLTLSAAFLFLGLAFSSSTRLARPTRLAGIVRWVFLLSAALAFAVLALMLWAFHGLLDVRFEIAIITITWPTLIAEGILLAFFFRRANPNSTPSRTP